MWRGERGLYHYYDYKVINAQFIISYLQSKFNGSEGVRLGQFVVTPEVVASKINNMKENKSPGVDGISPKY